MRWPSLSLAPHFLYLHSTLSPHSDRKLSTLWYFPCLLCPMRFLVGQNEYDCCCERVFLLLSGEKWRGAGSAACCWERGERCSSWGKNGRARVGFYWSLIRCNLAPPIIINTIMIFISWRTPMPYHRQSQLQNKDGYEGRNKTLSSLVWK